ncbi:glycosyltransferase family 2 protein [Streptomyces plumbidurans]|uniref:glycosyltransferase family 2 protein n=1 Tax=Streptomyces plumbidurans TaxID=2814589 RepID=UPI0021C66E57|nr:glycosyltransferase family 2 protein [Streptomyces plumbidurans]
MTTYTTASLLAATHDYQQPRVIALIPARNEADRIAAAIRGLQVQTRVPDEIITVTNNCTDNMATAIAARDAGAAVLDLRNVKGKKAGALNIGLDEVLPDLDDQDLILVQDADTVLNPSFVEHAAAAMRRKVGAVGGVFYGEDGGGLLGQLQRMEYQRYAWEIERNGERAVVLTGTATLFRVRVLREIKAARLAGDLPGGASYYTIDSLTEDDEITKAVKTLGYRTEVMKITGISTNTLTVTRAQNGSTAISTIAANDVVTGGNIPGVSNVTNGSLFFKADHGAQSLSSGDQVAYTLTCKFS